MKRIRIEYWRSDKIILMSPVLLLCGKMQLIIKRLKAQGSRRKEE
jgi:hypothetical protein